MASVFKIWAFFLGGRDFDIVDMQWHQPPKFALSSWEGGTLDIVSAK
jgi:hypothetical protein